MKYTEYLDENKAFVFVSCGISGGEVWMTVRQKSTTSGTHRIKSPRLPIQHTKDDAQKDLDAYAKLKGWQVYEPAPASAVKTAPEPEAPPEQEEKRILLCKRCLPNFVESFPFYNVTKGEVGKEKCGVCGGKKQDGVTTCVYSRKEGLRGAA